MYQRKQNPVATNVDSLPPLMSVAFSVDPDEYALGLSETNEMRSDSRGWERVQRITVVRSDRPAVYLKSLGPRDDFTADGFNIPSGVPDEATGRWVLVHTVAELQELADTIREQDPQSADIEPRKLDDSYYKAVEQVQDAHIGPTKAIYGTKGDRLQ